ncbi:MAG: hypothetical protein JNL64_03885 [Blastocatellia bacterium]|jgi:hypothetical protein|nr:hypothetical protein [Blastocatellia bacterium]
MRLLIVLSLILNIAVLVPVCFGIITDAAWAREAYGDSTAARGILLSIYLAIGLVSLGLLFRREPNMVAALILVQIIYKLTTPFTVGTITNPVVVSNLFIAVFHSVTLYFVYRSSRP